jgi:hypothetical protein
LSTARHAKYFGDKVFLVLKILDIKGSGSTFAYSVSVFETNEKKVAICLFQGYQGSAFQTLQEVS